MLDALKELYPDELEWKEKRMDGLWKTQAVRTQLLEGVSPAEIIGGWQEGLAFFKARRLSCLLY